MIPIRDPSRTITPNRPRPSRIAGWRSVLLLGVALLQAATAQGAAAATIDVQQHERAVLVTASATLKADLRTTWDTLVGYERLPEFVPDMRSSRAVQREGDQVLVQQSGRAGLGPIKKDFSLTLRVHETPMRSVTANGVGGDFARFESGYRLHTAEGGLTRLDYSALIEPRAASAARGRAGDAQGDPTSVRGAAC